MLKAIIEMPKGTRFKYEIDKTTGGLVLDRPINDKVPENYGFIPNTLCGDGDPLDVFVAALEPIPSLTQVEIEVIGIIRCKDGDHQDDKILAYVKGDWFGQQLITRYEIEGSVSMYLKSYKEGLRIEKIEGVKEALEEIANCRLDNFNAIFKRTNT